MKIGDKVDKEVLMSGQRWRVEIDPSDEDVAERWMSLFICWSELETS